MVQLDSQHAHVPPAQVARRIMRATGALMIIQIILRGFGIIEKMIMSHYFGTGDEANAYSAAKRIAEPIRQFGEQVVMHSFLPSFVSRLREHGDADAWRMASTIINLMGILAALVAAVGIFYTQGVLSLFVPGWMADHPELMPLTIKISRVMLVAMIFLTVSSVTYCLLNSYKQFALPASADLVLKATVLVFAIFFAGSWGAYALAIGFVVGAGMKVGVQALGLRIQLHEYRPVVDITHPGVKQFLLLALPLIVGWAFSTVRAVMDTRFLSHLKDAGGFSALDYAKTPCDIPVMFFPYVFGIALFPFLADIAVSGDKERLRSMLMSATRMMLLLFIPLTIAFIALRIPLILGMYGSQKFDMHSALLTAQPFQLYAIGMLVGALEIIVLQFFFAMSRHHAPDHRGDGDGAAAYRDRVYEYRTVAVGRRRHRIGAVSVERYESRHPLHDDATQARHAGRRTHAGTAVESRHRIVAADRRVVGSNAHAAHARRSPRRQSRQAAGAAAVPAGGRGGDAVVFDPASPAACGRGDDAGGEGKRQAEQSARAQADTNGMTPCRVACVAAV